MVDISIKDTVDGRYILDEFISENRLSLVYLAKDLYRNEDEIAIKIFKDERLVHRFKREFLILKKINHKNILRVFDFGLDRQRKLYYFTSEFLSSYKSIGENNLVDESSIWNIIFQSFAGLRAIHNEGLIHFDITPANIIVSPDLKNAKILDLGLASTLSDINDVRGTLFYIAPELLFNREFDNRVDQYSLGVTLYKLISNELPYSFNGLEDYLAKLETATPTHLKVHVPWISDDLNNFIQRLISTNKEERFPSTKKALDSLSLQIKKGDPNTEIEDIPFFGRAEELKVLNANLERAIEKGSPYFFIIKGERGVGKKTILSELKSSIELKETLVFEFDFGEHSGLKRLEKWLIFHEGDFSEPSSLEERLLNKLISISKKIRVIIIAYNAHAAKSEDIATLKYIMRGLRIETRKKIAPPIFLLTCDSEFDLGDDFTANFRDDLYLFDLPPLPLEKYESDLCKALSAKIDPIDLLFQYSRGIPLILSSLWEYLRNEKRISLSDDLLKIDFKNIKTPDKIYSLIRDKLALLPSFERLLLETIVIFGEPVDVHILEEILTKLGIDKNKIIVSLKMLFEKKLIVRKYEYGGTRIRPFNDIIQKICEENIKRDTKNRINYSIGKVLCSAADVDVDTRIKAGIHLLNGEGFKEANLILFSAINELYRYNRLSGALYIIEKLYAMRENYKGDDYYNIVREFSEIKRKSGEFKRASVELLKLHGKFKKKRLELNYLISNCMLLIHDYPSCYRYIDEGLKIAKSSQNDVECVKYLLLKSQVENGELKFDRAVKTAKRAIEIDEVLPEKDRNPTIYNTIGLSCYNVGDYKSAEKYLRAGLKLCDMSLNRNPKKVLILNNLGMLYFKIGSLNEAVDFYGRAIEIARLMDDKVRVALINKNLGTVHQKGLDYIRAIKSYEECIEILEKLGIKFEITITLFNLALIYFDLGDNQKYKYHMAQLWDIIKDGDEHKIMRAHYYCLKGDEASVDNIFADGLSHYSESLKIFTLLKNEYEIQRVKYSIAENYLKAGNIDESLKLSFEVQDESRKKNYEDLLAKVKLVMLFIKVAKENEKIFEVRNSLLKLKNETFARNNLEFRLAINIILARAFELSGDYVQAKSFYDIENEISNKICEQIPNQYKESFRRERERRFPMSMRFNITEDLKDKTYSAKLEKLFLINTKLNSNLNLDSILDIIIDTALTFANAERGFLVLSEDGQISVTVARNMEKKKIEDSKNKISKKIVNKVMETGTPIISNNISDDGRFDEYTSVAKLDLKSIFCIPFKIKDRIIGALYLDNTIERGLFSERDIKLIATFADQAAIAIENARLFAELEKSKREIEAFNAKLEKKVIMQAEELDIKDELLSHSKRPELKYDYKKIIGKSHAMMEVLTLLDKVMDSELPILIKGESGTGKELIARALHFNGLRKDKPFLTENCAALSETLLESELFGHRKGSFTGAIADKKGLFELANMGTIFLDEIGDMSINMQKKLLRVLQNGEIRRIGDDKVTNVDVRLISATNKDIIELVKEGKFREDLMYRINVIKIELPAITDRKEDIPFLIDYFVEKFCQIKEIPKIEIDHKIIDAFMEYRWPGNVREIENEIHRLITLSDKKSLNVDLIKDDIRFSKEHVTFDPTKVANMEQIEKNLIEKTLKECWWNKKKASELLKMSRPTLDTKIRKYNIKRDEQT